MPEEKDYILNVHKALVQKVEGFDVPEQEFRTKMQDENYIGKVHNALTKKVEGFDLDINDFQNRIGIKKKEETPSTSGGAYVRPLSQGGGEPAQSIYEPSQTATTQVGLAKGGIRGKSDAQIMAERRADAIANVRKEQEKANASGQYYGTDIVGITKPKEEAKGTAFGRNLDLYNKERVEKEKLVESVGATQTTPPKETKQKEIEKPIFEKISSFTTDLFGGINRAITNAPADVIKTGAELINYGGNVINKSLGLKSTKIEDNPVYQLADSYTNWMDNNVYQDVDKESMPSQIGSGLGQVLTMIGTGGASAGAKIATTGLKTGLKNAEKIKNAVKGSYLPFSQTFNSEYEQLKEAGESEDVSIVQAAENAFAAIPLEKFPIDNLVKRYTKNIGSDFTKRAINAIAQALEEGSTEALQQVISNLSNNQLVELDKNTKEWNKDVGNSAEVGGIVGLIIGTISGVAQGRLKKKLNIKEEPVSPPMEGEAPPPTEGGAPPTTPPVGGTDIAVEETLEEKKAKAGESLRNLLGKVATEEKTVTPQGEEPLVEGNTPEEIATNIQVKLNDIKTQRAKILGGLPKDESGKRIKNDEAQAQLDDLEEQEFRLQEYDSQNKQRVSGEVGEGQKPIETQPVGAGSKEAVDDGGIYEAPTQEVIIPDTPAGHVTAVMDNPTADNVQNLADNAVSLAQEVIRQGNDQGVIPQEKMPTLEKTPPVAEAPKAGVVEGDVESKKKSFTEAGEQSKKDQSPKALGNFIIDNAQVGDRIKKNEDEYYEVVSRKVSKRNGSTEIELQHFIKNEETGNFENNPSAVKIFTDKYRGTDLEKLGYRAASDLFESVYTNSNGEKVIEQSTYEPKAVEQSLKETPVAEAPKVEMPKVEAPIAEVAVAEAPKTEPTEALKDVESTAKALEGKTKTLELPFFRDSNKTKTDVTETSKYAARKIKENFDIILDETEQPPFYIIKNKNGNKVSDKEFKTKNAANDEALEMLGGWDKMKSEMLSEAYHADKTAGKETELVKAVEELLGKPTEAPKVEIELTKQEEKVAENLKISKDDARKAKQASPRRTRKSKDIAEIIESETKIAEDSKNATKAEELIETIEIAEKSILENQEVDESFEQKYGVSEIALVKEIKDMGKQGNLFDAYKNLTGKDADLQIEIDFLSSISAQGIKVRPRLAPEFTVENRTVQTKKLSKKPSKKKGLDSLDAIVGKDDLKPILKAVYFDGDKMVATDAHKLIIIARQESDADIIEKLIEANYAKTKKTVSTYTREQASAYIKEQLKDGLQGKSLNFQDGIVEEGRYPDYKVVIPTKYPSVAKIAVQEFIDILNGAKAVKDNLLNNNFAINFLVDNNNVYFNPTFLLEAVSAMQENGAKSIELFHNGDPSKAILLKSDNGNEGIVMPITVKDEFPITQEIDITKPAKAEEVAKPVQAKAKPSEVATKEAEAKPSEVTKEPAPQKAETKAETIEDKKAKAGESLRNLLGKTGVIKNIVPSEDSDTWNDIKNIADYIAAETGKKGKELIEAIKKYLKTNGGEAIIPQIETYEKRIIAESSQEGVETTEPTNIRIFEELDAMNEKRMGIGNRAKENKAFNEKHGNKAQLARDITNNFEKYIDKLKEEGIIVKVKC